jgi:DNA-binding MarR family transcriptional regulator
VRRERAQDDRREVLLGLTPKGERVLGELALHHHDELRRTAPDLVGALKRVMLRGDEVPAGQRAGRSEKGKTS